MNAINLRNSTLGLFVLLLAAFNLIFTADSKPTISFGLPQRLPDFPTFTSFTQQIIEKRTARQMKTYSGKRLSNDSLLMIYYHDATVAVTELGPQKLLLSCELIEIYNDKEGKQLLRELSKYNKPLEITLSEMFKLMGQCERVDQYAYKMQTKRNSVETAPTSVATKFATNIFPKSPLSLLSGIIPGTKWCGTGDIAETYHDLGIEIQMDRCCRQHDLCPVKLRALQKKYELMNDSLYTKSHCMCDDIFYACLKETNTSASQFMGSIYFNLVQVPCLTKDEDPDDEDSDDDIDGAKKNVYEFRKAKEF